MKDQPIIVRPKTSRRLLYDRRKTAPRVQITERDRIVLTELARHRFLTAMQLNRLAFRSPARRVRRRLRLLFDADIIDRTTVVGQPTHGVPSYLYSLTQRGADLIARDVTVTIQVPTVRSRSLRFVAHHVQVCNFYVSLNEALLVRNTKQQREDSPQQILQWQHEWQMKLPQPQGPPRAERVMIPDQRGTRGVTFLPDAFFELGVPGGDSYFFFFEMDRSTHGHKVWRERALAYAHYARPQHGLFRRRFGAGKRDTFRLLIVTPRDYRGRSRCNNILSTIEQTVGATNLFLGSTLPEIMPPNDPSTALTPGRARDQMPQPSTAILDPIWRQVGNTRRCSLLPTVRLQK